MSIILIIAIIWGTSVLARATKEAKAERERERLRREQAARSWALPLRLKALGGLFFRDFLRLSAYAIGFSKGFYR